MTQLQRKMKWPKQPQSKILIEIKHPPTMLRHLIWTSGIIPIFDSTAYTKPHPKKNPELPPIVVGYNPRRLGRYNLRPNPKPNVNPDFRKLDSVTTEDSRPTQS